MNINSRYTLEQSRFSGNVYAIIDTHKSEKVGQIHALDGCLWGFVLSDGRERMGGYNALLGSLKKMLKRDGRSLPRFD